MRKGIKNPGIGKGGIHSLKTHCLRGHLLSEENIWRHKNQRRCRLCSYLRSTLSRRRLKERVLNAYGHKCAWLGCEIIDSDMLTLDHVNNDGSKDRVRGVTSGDSAYRKIIKEGFPDRYQILCANHNLKKYLEFVRAIQL